MNMKTAMLICASALTVAAAANAGYTVTQSTAAAPTYANTLNFDEAGGPTGFVSSNAWTGYGISSIQDQDTGTGAYVIPGSTFPWMTNTSNVLYGAWGIDITFAQPVTHFSFQLWGNSGTPSFFGGGTGVFVTNSSGDILGGDVYTAAWGGVGKTWFNIEATGGDTITRVLIPGFGQGLPEQMIDNLSWNTVPGPGAVALLALGLAGRGRRRA